MSSQKENCPKFHDGQYRSIVPFMLYADFESIIRPVDEQYRQKMDQIKADDTQNINTHVASGWCVNNTFAYADVSYPLRKYHGKAVFTLAYAAITAYATFSQ